MQPKNYGSLLKQKIIETYPEYLSQFPNYRKALDIMEVVMNEVKPERALTISKFDEEIKKAIQTPPELVIELIPEKEPTLLTWNGDYYFDNYYMWLDFRGKSRKLIATLELLANTSAYVKLFLSSRLHLILYDMTNYYDLPIVEALKLKQTFPITQLMNRIRSYFQIPVIKMKDLNPIEEDLEEMKEKVKQDPNNEKVKKYSAYVDTFEKASGLKLSTDEKIEFIAEKLLDEIIGEDYDEVES